MKPQVFYTRHEGGITLMINGTVAVVDKTNPNFDKILADLKAGKFEAVIRMTQMQAIVQDAFDTVDKSIKVVNGELIWRGPNGNEKLAGPLVDRIIKLVRDENADVATAVQPLVKLMSNIQRNKAKDIREELYQFLMACELPITVDGCFLAYKKVRSDFKDIYTGKMDNSPGKLVAQDPATVDTNRHNHCSRGLHFCARGYLSSYGSGHNSKIVVVKVNPRHVYAIPTDYDFMKGRASEYFIVGEIVNFSQADQFLAPFIYDENAAKVAPNVKFIGEGESFNAATKPSLLAMAEGYGYITPQGRVFVRVMTTKGDVASDRYTVVHQLDDTTFVSAITGKPVPAEHVKAMSYKTKSVRQALVRACARRRARA